tara:strand:- start:1169 stop:1399 length:231 start_codon:yes stop_codon:yes gene_type:complete
MSDYNGDYPSWEYNHQKKEICIYFSEYDYIQYFDEDAENLYKDLEFGNNKTKETIFNELYLERENQDPYRRSEDLI